jgi:hypothetical protein
MKKKGCINGINRLKEIEFEQKIREVKLKKKKF